jgi:hypothetical protein
VAADQVTNITLADVVDWAADPVSSKTFKSFFLVSQDEYFFEGFNNE